MQANGNETAERTPGAPGGTQPHVHRGGPLAVTTAKPQSQAEHSS